MVAITGGKVNNPGIELDLEWIGGVRCNLPAINRR